MTDSAASDSSDSDAALLAQLGGKAGLQAIIDEMYRRVLGDPELMPFFEGVKIDKLISMQTEFIASITSGEIRYTGADLTKVHAGRGITRHHFTQFCSHMIAAMQARQVDAFVIDQVLGRVAMYSDKITGDANVDG